MQSLEASETKVLSDRASYEEGEEEEDEEEAPAAADAPPFFFLSPSREAAKSNKRRYFSCPSISLTVAWAVGPRRVAASGTVASTEPRGMNDRETRERTLLLFEEEAEGDPADAGEEEGDGPPSLRISRASAG